MDKSSYKTLGDAVGMPDKEDRDMIRKIILRYEKKHPGFILNARNEAKRDFFEQGGRKQKFGEVNKQSQGRIIFELPEDLYHQLEEYIPTLFRDKKHFQWFVKNFKELMIPEAY